MQHLKNKKLSILLICALCFSFAVPSFAAEMSVNGDNPRFSISSGTLVSAISKLGHNVTPRKNSEGMIYYHFDEAVENVKAITMIPADCGKAGCTDIILYADFGAVTKMTAEHINGWNHVRSLKRSKAFRSDSVAADGHVGLSMVVSFLDDSEEDKFAMQAGLFLSEVGIFSKLVENVSKL